MEQPSQVTLASSHSSVQSVSQVALGPSTRPRSRHVPSTPISCVPSSLRLLARCLYSLVSPSLLHARSTPRSSSPSSPSSSTRPIVASLNPAFRNLELIAATSARPDTRVATTPSQLSPPTPRQHRDIAVTTALALPFSPDPSRRLEESNIP